MKIEKIWTICYSATGNTERTVKTLAEELAAKLNCPVEHHCRAFRYDPLKRVPPRPAALNTKGLKDEDFSL